MAIEMNIGGLNNGSLLNTVNSGSEANQAQGEQKAQGPLLSGQSLTLSQACFGDLTRLLLTFQLENAEKRFQLTSLQFNSILDTLNAMNAITQEQYSSLSTLSLEIDALDEAIKRATKTSAERKKELEAKQQRLDDINEKILAEEREIEQLEASIAAGTGLSEAEVAGVKSQIAAKNEALKTGKAELVQVEGEIVKLNSELKVAMGTVSDLSTQRTAKQQEVASLVNKLDFKAKSILVENIMLKASNVEVESEESPREAEEKEKKEEERAASGPLAVVRQQLLEEMKKLQEEREQKTQVMV